MTQKRTDAPEREERINAVLLEYVEAVQSGRTPDRRRLLAAHPEFRAELEEFFASHDHVERLAAPLREAAEQASSAPATGAAAETVAELGQLGDFRLLREIGRGGMGVVYEAQQISLRRRVALKVLPFAAAIDPRQLQRFQNEALAAAHLRHENVVPVYAVGCERGVHYYAMQFIEGQSLATLIGELRRRADGPGQPETTADTTGPYFGSEPSATLPVGTATPLATSITQDRSSGNRRYFHWVAGLGRQAAAALEHAHQMGIVHRDIKPANLLLDPRGQLWVADFGLAQFSSNAGLTVTGEVLGTLRYASPEQALAKPGLLDHRTDIYSLGATLYELLTLRPIFDGRDRQELLRQIATDEPRPPRLVERAIPVELETIILKALAKEPSDRYATARELADDLQRFLEDRPILARRPTLLEQGTKWPRRHRPVVATAVAVLLLSVAGLSAATVLIAQAYDRERQRADEAKAAVQRAEDSFRQARKAVDQFAEIGAEELAGDPYLERARRMLLEAALAYYQDFIEQRRDDPSLQKEFADSSNKINLILEELTAGNWVDRHFFLRRPAVQSELMLTEDQLNQIHTLDWEWLEDIRKSSRLDPRERDRHRAAQASAVAQVLDRWQQRRFKQIALQLSGPTALLDPEVAEHLQLTVEQKKQVGDIESETSFEGRGFGGPRGERRGGGPGEMRGGPFEGGKGKGGGPKGKGGGKDKGKGPPGGPDGGRRGPPPWLEAWRREQDDKVQKLLTPEQQQRWKELIGPEFKDGGPPGPPRD